MKKQPKLNFPELITQLPKRDPAAHKGDFGTVVIVGGNIGLAGAPILAAQASYRVGAGLVKVVTRPEYATLATSICPEILTEGVSYSEQLKLSLSRASVIVVGPGLGQDDWAISLLQTILLHCKLPMVVDADALRLLARFPQTRQNWVLTPHLGEAAALMKKDIAEIQDKRAEAAIAIQSQYGGAVVIKGQNSLVLSPGEKIPAYCPHGNPGMATAGMGDILSGVIAGLLAQGLSIETATQLGVALHAKAGDAAAKKGERGMIASDLLPHLRDLVNE